MFDNNNDDADKQRDDDKQHDADKQHDDKQHDDYDDYDDDDIHEAIIDTNHRYFYKKNRYYGVKWFNAHD